MPWFESTSVAHAELFEGGYYSIADSEVFSIAKILNLEADIVHVTFMSRKPSFLTLAEVQLSELEGYNLRKETSDSGVWE